MSNRKKNQKLQKYILGAVMYLSFKHPKILDYGIKIITGIMHAVALIYGMADFWSGDNSNSKEHKSLKK
jgi:hypothetical protein